MVFHAGTAFSGDEVVTNDGRVLGVTSFGDTMEESIRNAYRAVGFVLQESLFCRTDIRKKALARTSS